MLQLWIMPHGVHPLDAVRSGGDRLVCGDCRGRPGSGGWCYVYPNPLLSIWRGRARWRRLEIDKLPDRPIRLGAWGDPAFLPFPFLSALVADRRSTGFTHQWRACDQRLRSVLMASVDTAEDAREARKQGWRTFRVRLPGEPLLSFEADCESVSGATCIECLSCHGGRAPCRSIEVHGYLAARYAKFREAEELETRGA
jgi:hypothetical protein